MSRSTGQMSRLTGQMSSQVALTRRVWGSPFHLWRAAARPESSRLSLLLLPGVGSGLGLPSPREIRDPSDPRSVRSPGSTRFNQARPSSTRLNAHRAAELALIHHASGQESVRSYATEQGSGLIDRRGRVQMPRSKAQDLLTGEAAFICHGARHTT